METLRPHRPRAIAPLVRRYAGGPRLESLGVQDLHEPSELLFENHAALEELADALAGLPHPLWFPRLPSGRVSYAARIGKDDRLIAVGDMSWQDYEVTVPVTVPVKPASTPVELR